MIRWLRGLRFGQVVRTEGPETHLRKAGTPTMGGVLIIHLDRGVRRCCGRTHEPVRADHACGVPVAGGLGFLDDYLKVVRGARKAWSAATS